MNDQLTPAQRLIVAADFKPPTNEIDPRGFVEKNLIRLAESLTGLDCYIKVNSALRILGYETIQRLHNLGLHVFADLKLNDIPETLATDAVLLSKFRPELLTVMCSTGPKSINAVYKALPDTEILGVTALTSLDEEDANISFGTDIRSAVIRLISHTILKTEVRSFVCSPAEVGDIRAEFDSDINLVTPGIRPSWTIVQGDDQNSNRVMTPAKAIQAGSTRIVVGRPILQASDPREAAIRTIEEIVSALSA
jgi:orotidine-5'-phosphate decarboxylase